jgi:lipopolysaccharide export system protein LptA
LRRVVLMEGVRLSQPGRTGTGEMLVYNAVEANYTLSGTPGHLPHIVDTKQGSITGATLLFHDEGTGAANSTIIVNGSDTPGKPGRVRTEVEVRGK